jgi:hypothetical protein
MSTPTELQTRHDELVKKLQEMHKLNKALKEEAEKKEAERKTAKILELRCNIMEALVESGKCFVCEPGDYKRVRETIASPHKVFISPDDGYRSVKNFVYDTAKTYDECFPIHVEVRYRENPSITFYMLSVVEN